MTDASDNAIRAALNQIENYVMKPVKNVLGILLILIMTEKKYISGVFDFIISKNIYFLKIL